ncbi:LD-carboxypeptidase [Actinoplanes sp. NPDC023801]|uniref:S66 peptidase family protein n=1 Tax=Actinoplanes sp. NPDC023801 TaxID=3154595 RepID=UPI0033E0D13B
MIDAVAVRPPRLRAGDLVALVAPAGPVPQEQAAGAERILAGWGLRTRRGRHSLGRHGFLSGTDDERLDDLNAALRDPAVRGVLCLRGGYGSQRIVDRVDYDAVRADPKVIVGFSDITALHLALWCEARLATVHGPVGVALRDGTPAAEAVRRTMMTTASVVVAAVPSPGGFAGRAEGLLLGGNLTLLAASCGTRHQPPTAGAILLLEEVNEAAYRVDRSLVQLRRSGWFDGLAGVAVGHFTNCPGADGVLAEHLGELGVPVLSGLPIGHDLAQIAVPLGLPARLDTAAGTLTVGALAR